MTKQSYPHRLLVFAALAVAAMLGGCVAHPIDGASNDKGAYVGFGAGFNR